MSDVHNSPTPSTPILDGEPVIAKSKFWTLNAGQVATMGIFALTLIWATAVYATKSSGDANTTRDIAIALRARIETVDAKSAALDGRMIGVEHDIVYIRESLARIEHAVTVPKP